MRPSIIIGLSLSIGIVLGQTSMLIAYNPTRMFEAAADLAQSSYVRGCKAAGNISLKECHDRGKEFRKHLGVS